MRLCHHIFFIFDYMKLNAYIYKQRCAFACELGEEYEKGYKYGQNKVYRKTYPTGNKQQSAARNAVEYAEYDAQNHEYRANERKPENTAEIAYQHDCGRVGNVYALGGHVINLHRLTARGKRRYAVVKLAHEARFYGYGWTHLSDYCFIYKAEFEAVDYHYAEHYANKKNGAGRIDA